MESDKIYRDLKDRIIWLDLAPESVLNVSELADREGVSRTPIKEALIRLLAEGWLLRQGSTFMVTPLSLDRIKEITEIRSVMEVQANVWAAQRIGPQELETLEGLGREMAALGRTASNKDLIQLDFRVHRTLFQATRNAQLAGLLGRLLDHYLRFWISIPREIDPVAFFADFPGLFEAIRAKDELKIRTISQVHITRSVEEIMLSFLSRPGDTRARRQEGGLTRNR